MDDLKTIIFIIGSIITWLGSWFTAWFHVKSKILILEKEVESVKEDHKEHSAAHKELVEVLQKLDVTMNTTLARLDERMKGVEDYIKKE